MPKGDATSTASGMLEGVKNWLGFAPKEKDAQPAAGDYEEYDDFESDGYNARDDREYAGYGSDYNENASAAPVGGYQPITTRSSYSATTRSSRFGKPDSTPDLVTIDDVKANTSVTDGYRRDAASPAGSSTRSTYRSGRELIDNTGPAESSPAYNAAMSGRANPRRSEGFESLFEPTDGSPVRDTYDAYSNSTTSAYRSTRGLTVVRPTSYNDVERVTRALKAGDVVVLAMRTTPEDLAKRVLDFSFGAASALDASVECPGPKVFVIARGLGLTDDEKRRLNVQGVL